MTRELLVHLNVEASDTDTRTADEIADWVLAAIEVGSDDDTPTLVIVCPLAEEIA